MAAGVSAPKTLSQKWAQALVSARAARPGRQVATTPPARAPSAPFSACRREVGRASALVNSSNRDGSIDLSFFAGRTTRLQLPGQAQVTPCVCVVLYACCAGLGLLVPHASLSLAPA